MKGYKQLTEAQKMAVLASYERTRTVTATARDVGVTAHQVRHLLKQRGIALTRAQERSACWRHQDLLRELAARGASLSEMQRQIGGNRRQIVAFLRRHSIPHEPFRQAGENNPAWRGGRVIDQDGYVLLKQSDHPHADRHGYVREHRLVMERTLGRYLDPSEVVHHKDGDRQNNAPENLEVFGANGAHLAATLTGKPHNLTPEGRAKLRAPRNRRARPAQTAIPAA